MSNHHNFQATFVLPKHITLDASIYEDRYLSEYSAKDENLGKDIFVQIIKSPKLEQLIYEWDKVAKQSSHLLTFYEAGKVSDGRSYFAYDLDYPNNISSLATIKGEMSLPETISLFKSLTQTISMLHNSGYIYGSLSPDRVLVSTDLDSNVYSFYIRHPCYFAELGYDMNYRRIDSEKATDHQLKIINSLHPVGFPPIPDVLQTLFEKQKFIDAWIYCSVNPYISPEYTLEKTNLTDLYSIGIVLYWLLSDRIPLFDFERIGLSDVERILYQKDAAKFLLFRFLDSVILQKLIDPVDLSIVPNGFQEIIGKLVSRIEKKYHDIGELIYELDNIFAPKQIFVVTDKRDKPVRRAYVTLKDIESNQFVAQGFTDNNGQVVMDGLFRKSYLLTITNQEYEQYSTNINPGEVDTINVHLKNKKTSLLEKIKKLFSRSRRK